MNSNQKTEQFKQIDLEISQLEEEAKKLAKRQQKLRSTTSEWQELDEQRFRIYDQISDLTRRQRELSSAGF